MAAEARLVKNENGDVIRLWLDGKYYGEYPLSYPHNAALQIEMMLNDARDYGHPTVAVHTEPK